MRYFIFSFVLLLGCASDYKGLRAVQARPCVDVIPFPAVRNSWYAASVDVVGKHLSGLLLIKSMPDSSDRVVFTNEAGVTFFDFGYDKNSSFTVHKIVPQMDKKAVVNLLRKDFALVLGKPFEKQTGSVWQMDDEYLYGVREKNETSYFITDSECASLHRVELGSDRKRKVTAIFFGPAGKPDSIRLDHHTFEMKVTLKKLER